MDFLGKQVMLFLDFCTCVSTPTMNTEKPTIVEEVDLLKNVDKKNARPSWKVTKSNDMKTN